MPAARLEKQAAARRHKVAMYKRIRILGRVALIAGGVGFLAYTLWPE